MRTGGKNRAWPRLVALDLDGTLLQTDGTISARCTAALKDYSALGGKVVLATGQPTASALRHARALGPACSALVSSGGATVTLPSEDGAWKTSAALSR